MQIEIRDTRKKEMFRMDDEYLNGYARLCGINATGVYMSLCRHANLDQQSWPSIELLQVELGLGSNRTVLKAIKKLEEWNIISVVRSKNEATKRQNPNVYILMDKSRWKAKPSAPSAYGAECISGRDPSAFKNRKPSAYSALEGSPSGKGTHRREFANALGENGEDLGFIKTC